ncbi:MAG: hypothetical protein JO013_12540 [Alphaproteobacteria bacterium]|nr:hypothetical protein [Alphaproteobacteria bacterium]
MVTGYWGILSAVIAGCLAVVICTFALAVAWRIWTETIDLTFLLAEPVEPDLAAAEEVTPKASLSRFQFLIFTFVIAGVYLVLCLESGRFVEIPQNVILLLGVSGTSYAASKGIQAATVTSQKHAEAAVQVAQATSGTAPTAQQTAGSTGQTTGTGAGSGTGAATSAGTDPDADGGSGGGA